MVWRWTWFKRVWALLKRMSKRKEKTKTTCSWIRVSVSFWSDSCMYFCLCSCDAFMWCSKELLELILYSIKLYFHFSHIIWTIISRMHAAGQFPAFLASSAERNGQISQVYLIDKREKNMFIGSKNRKLLASPGCVRPRSWWDKKKRALLRKYQNTFKTITRQQQKQQQT